MTRATDPRPFDPERDCHDCGARDAKHEDAPCSYCRRCAEKNGYRCEFFVTLDRDVVREKFGRELADRIFALDEGPQRW